MHAKLWTGQYSLVIGLTFIFYLSLQALLGGFPVYVTEFSHHPAYGGLMTTAFMLASVISRPVMGAVIRKINMKKGLIMALVFVFAVILLSLHSKSVPFLFVLRLLQGVGFGVTSTLFATFITNVIPERRLGEGIGYFGMAMSVGTTIGPMVSLSLMHGYSFDLALFFSAFLILVTIAGGLLIGKKYAFQNEGQEPEAKPSFFESAFDMKAFMPCLLVMFFYVTFAGIVNFIDSLGSSVGLGGKTSFFFLVLVIMLVVIRPFSGRIYDHFGHAYLVYPAIFSAIIGLLLVASMRSFGVMVVAAIFYGLAYGVMQPTFQAWAVSRVRASHKATANAMAMSFMDFGQAIGAVLLGFVAGKTGYSSMYGLSALLVVIMLGLYFAVRVRAKVRRHAQRRAS